MPVEDNFTDGSSCKLGTIAGSPVELLSSSQNRPESPSMSATSSQSGSSQTLPTTNQRKNVQDSIPRVLQSSPSFLSGASRLLDRVRSNPSYQKVERAVTGSRFNVHARRVRRFSRRAAVYSWIEPTALLVSFAMTFSTYSFDSYWFIPLYIIISLVVSELLILLFSLAILGIQALKAQRKDVQPLSFNRSSNPNSNQPQIDSTTVANSSGTNGSSTRASRCATFRPPQVVRWDIIGVTLSSWFGKVNSISLHTQLREPLFKLYSWYFGVNLSEIKQPLRSFRSMQEFFTRELRTGARPVASNCDIVSPVDARLVVGGLVCGDQVEQVKGANYHISNFLGEDIWNNIANKRLFHCVLYLAPGDYHRIHSATTWELTHLRHFPGTLFPISPIFARLVPNLFSLNERVLLAGTWKHGFFSSTAVGAYHVGSMSFNFDHTVRTNKVRRDFTNPNLAYLSTRDLGAYAYHFTYPPGRLQFQPGEEMGTFKLGSTIVLFFEVPQDCNFEFTVAEGEKIKMGQALGSIVPRTDIHEAAQSAQH